MAVYKYSDDEIQFVKDHAEGMFNDDLAELFNKNFKVTHMTESKMKSFKANHKIKSNLKRRRKTPSKKLFSEDQVEFIKCNVKGIGNKELTQKLNKHFGSDYSVQQVRSLKKRMNLRSGLTGHFNEGHIPVNKGTKGMFNVGGNRTSFKKGFVPHNYQPVGTVRVNTDGYVDVKVSDYGPPQKRWRGKHRVIWEEEYGEIPEGHLIIFLDGDKQNLELDNLKLINRQQLQALNRNGWKFDDKELTETGLLLANLSISMHAKLKGGEEE